MPEHTESERAKTRAAKKKKKPTSTRNPFMQFLRRVFDPTGSLERAEDVFTRTAREHEERRRRRRGGNGD